ncbi:B3 domain-containing transcription factor ABI3-like [Salvia splendens]|uniref:B3 domain-containing transcription factor ABI3-like n=1 Tax=Salvia splendens TaxID=180675 RepID=UPI001C2672C2|nr:B3 domain-containing transcription factor ABI3-like [Salvia splendens]
MVKVAAAEQDLHFSCAGDEAVEVGGGGGVANANPNGFEEDRIGDKDMWLDRDQDGLFDVNEASIFYDDFPLLLDFPCTSSCSSSMQPEPKPVTGSSSPSSATSWVDEDGSIRMSFPDEVKMDAGYLGNVDCIDVMENLEYMDLIDCNSLYGNPYAMYGSNGEKVMRLGSSATREARKKRMARQRRSLYSHYSRHSESQPNSNMQPQRQAATAAVSDWQQQQGWKTEKNLKFLLQKVLKQSDIGNLGRIVLPKKEAESHLPELETRDGISIAMEDIGTSRVWNMRYRFWPNNKSRMYLLENTGDFVRVNELQQGDFIVIYSDTKCGKYMIRGVKVRQPGGKLEAKKPARRNIRSLSSLAGNSSSLAPIRQAVR